VMMGIIGIMADLISINRKLLEDGLIRLKRMEYEKFNKFEEFENLYFKVNGNKFRNKFNKRVFN